MKPLNRKKTLLYIALGLLLIALYFLVSQDNLVVFDSEISGFLSGLIFGAGVGLIITALIKGRFKKA